MMDLLVNVGKKIKETKQKKMTEAQRKYQCFEVKDEKNESSKKSCATDNQKTEYKLKYGRIIR